MREGWKIEEFRNCFSPIKIPNKIQRKDFLETGQFPIISQEIGMINGYWNDHNDLIHISRPIIIFGDHTQILKLVDFDFVAGADGTKPLSVSSELIPEFAYYFLLSSPVKSKGYSRHYKYLKEKTIPVPPLSEQKEIVAILDEAFAAIDVAKANTEKNLANAREVFESHLNRVFEQKGEGWEEKKLGDISKITSSKRIYKSDYVSDGIPFYRTKEIKELANKRAISVELFISNEKFKDLESRFGVPRPGDILVTAIGTIGEIYVVRPEDNFYFKDGNIIWISNIKYTNPNYILYALRSFVLELNKMSQGAAYNALPIYKLSDYKIPIPCLNTQDLLVYDLDTLTSECESLVFIYQKKLAALDELKQSLLHKAFTGELTAKKGVVEKEMEGAGV